MGLCRGVTCACACEYQPSFVSAIFHTIQTVLSLTLFLYETVIVYIWPDEGTSCQKLPLPSPPPFPTSRVILSRSGTRKSWLTCVSSALTSFQRSPLIIYRQLHVLTFCPLNHNFAAFFLERVRFLQLRTNAIYVLTSHINMNDYVFIWIFLHEFFLFEKRLHLAQVQSARKLKTRWTFLHRPIVQKM